MGVWCHHGLEAAVCCRLAGDVGDEVGGGANRARGTSGRR
jgi:hypothetical protein